MQALRTNFTYFFPFKQRPDGDICSWTETASPDWMVSLGCVCCDRLSTAVRCSRGRRRSSLCSLCYNHGHLLSSAALNERPRSRHLCAVPTVPCWRSHHQPELNSVFQSEC